MAGVDDALSPGVLGPREAHSKFTLRKLPPCPDLAPFVEYHWLVSWDLRGSPPFTQRVVPHPNVHLVFEPTGTWLYGVLHGLFTRTLTGRAHVLGVRFHPGGFRPWLGTRVSSITDRTLPGGPFLAGEPSPPGAAPSDRVLSAASAAEAVAAAEALLLPRAPAADPLVEEVRALVDAIAADRALTRVDALARHFGRTVRSVQRLFNDYVGVGPKWVIRRFRLHEAATRADAGDVVDWARLATDLGYSDQAHFVREFTATVGVPPARYAAGG